MMTIQSHWDFDELCGPKTCELCELLGFVSFVGFQ
jgi:hypothetical protein